MMNKILYFLAVLILMLCVENLRAQDKVVKNCWTVEYENYLMEKFPEDRSSTPDFEEWLSKQISNIDRNKQRATLWTVPVVFHIFHDGTGVGVGPNLSQARIQNQIDQLNIDFANLAGSTDPVAGDSQIQFCAATIDPSGACMPEPGIDRINNSTEGFTGLPHSTNYIEATTKPATSWLPNEYLNVWVTLIAANDNLLGYAQFPSQSGLAGLANNGGPAATDGVFVDYRTVGSIANPGVWGAYAGSGRILTHELGHFFGLRHIWGDGGCGVDDFCNDTPASDAENFGCPTAHISCGTTDMVRNFMDYTDDSCMRLFTQDQADRMFIVMGGNGAGTGALRRESLASSIVCGACNSCGSMVVLSGNQTGILDQESADWITSTQAIQAGASVDYDATTFVQLNPGFCTPAGANFNAFIDGCNSGAGGINLRDNGSDDVSKLDVIRDTARDFIQKAKQILFTNSQ